MAPPSSSSPGPSADDLTGRVLAGRYRLNRPIAAGGMAEVWEATDQTLARRVAVKILHPHLARDESFVRRFRQEAVAAARLAHPSIVSVYDTVADQGTNAIVMELVSGTTMRADLDQHGPMQLAAVLAIGTQVADALGAAHASGLVHRDVKPANILLSSDGRVLVADFGIAKAAEGADLTSDGSMVGTAKYLAPEQVEGTAIDGRADLYALGVVLYEALAGTPPFVADNDTGTALARLHRDPTPLRQLRPQVPATVEHVVTRALSRYPDDRYPDAASMRRALLDAGADPSQAPAVAQAAVAADTGERPAARRRPAPPPAYAPAPAAAHTWTAPPPPPAPVAPLAPVDEPLPHAGHHPGPVEYDEDDDAPLDPYVDEDHPAPPRRRRWPLVLVLTVLLVGALVLGGQALTRSGTATATGPQLPISGVIDFDPVGGDGERPEDLAALTDDDPATAWRTERYVDAEFGGLKDGVGVVAAVAEPTDLGELTLTTPVGGWSAAVYVVDGPPPLTLEEWGDPVGTVDDATDGTVEVELGGRRGQAVLVWFTRLAPDGDDRFAARLGAIRIRGT